MGCAKVCCEASPGSLTPPCCLCPGVGVPAAAAKAAAKAAKFGEPAWGAPQCPRQPWCGTDQCRVTLGHIIPHEHGVTPAASPFCPQVLGLEGCQERCPAWAECPESHPVLACPAWCQGWEYLELASFPGQVRALSRPAGGQWWLGMLKATEPHEGVAGRDVGGMESVEHVVWG